MLINVYFRERDDSEEELAGYTFDERNLGHILGMIFEEHYDDEFEVRIEVVDEVLESARQRALH